MTNIEIDGVEYENCEACRKEIIATQSHRCLDCFQKNKTKPDNYNHEPQALGLYGSASRWR